MCNYKPLVISFLLTALFSLIMLFFTMAMWMYIGDYYPSSRYRYTWYWSLFSYVYEFFICIVCSMMLYKENIAKFLNALCFSSLFVLILNWISWISISLPEMTHEEFKTYVFEFLASENTVPRFMQYFQFSIGCCGIDDYTDYIKIFGTHLDNTTGLTSFKVPRSCCHLNRTRDRNCGDHIPFRSPNDFILIDSKINARTVGCFKRFQDIVYGKSSHVLRLFDELFKYMPIFFLVFTFINCGVYIYYYYKTKSRINIVFTRGPDEAELSLANIHNSVMFKSKEEQERDNKRRSSKRRQSTRRVSAFPTTATTTI